MRKLYSLVAALQAVAMLGVGGAAKAENDPADTSQILTIERTISAATAAQQVLKYAGTNMVFDDLTPGEVHGYAKFAADITAQFGTIKNIKATILSMTVVADPHVAFAFSRQKFSAIVKQTNSPISVTFRQVDGYSKQGGNWLLIYQNLSVPYDPKTGKAVFDAAP